MAQLSNSTCSWIARVIIAVLLPVLLAGCGFQLRGSSALPPEMAVTYIKSNQPYGSLVDDFTEALLTHNVRITHDPIEASSTLHIISNEIEQRLLSVSTVGQVLEYELVQTIVFSVKGKDNQVLVGEQKVTMSRDYLYNSNDILGKEREKRVVSRTLQKSVVNMAMLRITAAVR